MRYAYSICLIHIICHALALDYVNANILPFFFRPARFGVYFIFRSFFSSAPNSVECLRKKTRTGQMANNLLIQLFNWNLPRYNKYTDRCETGWESIQLFDWQNSRYSNCSNLNRSKKWCSSFSLNMNVLNRHTKKWLLRNGGSKSTAHVDNSMEHNLKNEESVQMLWKIQLFSLLKLLTIP